MASERLQKVLAAAGFGSRRSCEGLITRGAVTVNGAPVIELGAKANPLVDDIRVNGRRVRTEDKVYLLLNKPAGFTTTRSDAHARRTVMQLLSNVKERVSPVGRLDVDTEGVLLFTNDGELAHRLTHPSYGVYKVYRAVVRGLITPHAIDRLTHGVRIGDDVTAPAHVKLLSSDPAHDASNVEITLHEGKKRQVKEMMRAVGFPVTSLRRTEFAGLTAFKLPTGCYRHLKSGEVSRLRKLCAMPNEG